MKLAAVWARVSTHNQSELSLESQVERAKAKLESQGYTVPPDMVLAVDWTSMDLYACPEFQKLIGWLKGKEISALGVLDRDRLAAKGLQRLTFLADCKEAGVELVVCQGPAILDEPEGQLVELALAIGKERQVLRAQLGAKDGLRDRAMLKGLPPSPVNPYGYAWDATRTRLVATKDWTHAKFILDKALEGMTTRGLCVELYRLGIPSPRGLERWARSAIYTIITNPVYGGRFYALRWENVEPEKRRGNSYGKSCAKAKPLAEAQLLPDIVVETPPLTWEQWLALQERVSQNKRFARRNARRDYLLRGLITCESHHHRYQGHTHRGKTEYVCGGRFEHGVEKCASPILDGNDLEGQVKAICEDILTRPEVLEREIAKSTGQVAATVKAIEKKLAELERKDKQWKATEGQLIFDRAHKEGSPEAFEMAFSRLKAERAWVAEEQERLQAELAATHQKKGAILGLAEARERLCQFLKQGDNASWREVFTALGLEIRVELSGKVVLSLSLPMAQIDIVPQTPWGSGRARARASDSPRRRWWSQARKPFPLSRSSTWGRKSTGDCSPSSLPFKRSRSP